MNQQITLAIDVMGGDNAPKSTMQAVDIALNKYKNITFLLYGDKEKIRGFLTNSIIDRCQIHHAPYVIASTEKPSTALRRGKNSSMYMAVEAVKNGEADASVSAGNTGALMAISKVLLRSLNSIDRPAIGTIIPSRKSPSVFLDMGANIECDANNLFQFALMGSSFARIVLGIENPKIGLLNVGEEDMKGRDSVKMANQILRESKLSSNYYGYIEGNDMMEGVVDVIVTDGFTGNIALKTMEGTGKLVKDLLKSSFNYSVMAKLGFALAFPAIRKLMKNMDPRHYNGAMFLGLSGISVKSHGSTDHIGFANSIEVALSLVDQNINDKIKKDIEYFCTMPHESTNIG